MSLPRAAEDRKRISLLIEPWPLLLCAEDRESRIYHVALKLRLALRIRHHEPRGQSRCLEAREGVPRPCRATQHISLRRRDQLALVYAVRAGGLIHQFEPGVIGERSGLCFASCQRKQFLPAATSNAARSSSRDRARAPGGSVADDAAPSANAGGSPARCAGARRRRVGPHRSSAVRPSPAGATTGRSDAATSRAPARAAAPSAASRLPFAAARIALWTTRSFRAHVGRLLPLAAFARQAAFPRCERPRRRAYDRSKSRRPRRRPPRGARRRPLIRAASCWTPLRPRASRTPARAARHPCRSPWRGSPLPSTSRRRACAGPHRKESRAHRAECLSQQSPPARRCRRVR